MLGFVGPGRVVGERVDAGQLCGTRLPSAPFRLTRAALPLALRTVRYDAKGEEFLK